MTVESFDIDGKTYKILLGFGRKQKARYYRVLYLPDKLKRIVSAGGTLEKTDFTPEDILDYASNFNPALLKLVLQSASDWDPSKMGVDEYVDTTLDENAGSKIVERVQAILDASSLSDDQKKTA